MSQLDDRQIEILGKIGVDIWRKRDHVIDGVTDRVIAGETSPSDTLEEAAADLSPVQGADNLGQLDQLDQLAQVVRKCQKCPLHTTRTHAVPGVGSSDADWMFVGEAPGQSEDEQGLPFVGRAGQLLDAMIAALRMERKDVFIANVIKCRPPENRDPLNEEVDECEPYLHQQLNLIKPKIIIALGRISAQSLLKTTEPIGKLRGKVHYYGELQTPLIPTYHPAYLLRSPQQKSKAWEDLLLAKSIVEK